VEIYEVQRAGETGNAIGNFVLYLASMLPVHALVCNFPIRKIKESAVFNAVGLVDYAAGFTGKGRVWGRVRHAPTVRIINDGF
jgi:hypothetical protein